MRRLFIEVPFHWGAFSSKRLFIKAPFHQSAFSSKRLFIKAPFHRSTFSSKHLFIEAPFHQSTFSSKRLFIEAPFHQSAFSSKRLFIICLFIEVKVAHSSNTWVNASFSMNCPILLVLIYSSLYGGLCIGISSFIRWMSHLWVGSMKSHPITYSMKSCFNEKLFGWKAAPSKTMYVQTL